MSRTKRKYPAAPIEDRLQWWLNRKFGNSAFMRLYKNKTHLQLPQKLTEGLGLPDSFVTITSDGELYHRSSRKPLAHI